MSTIQTFDRQGQPLDLPSGPHFVKAAAVVRVVNLGNPHPPAIVVNKNVLSELARLWLSDKLRTRL